MATPLVSLNAKWMGLLRPGSGEGVEFDCPLCGPKHRLAAYFANPLDGLATAPWHEVWWVRRGEALETLTLAPSLDYSATCGWHGWVENGHVVDFRESPMAVGKVRAGNTGMLLGDFIFLSPRVAALVAELIRKDTEEP